MSAPAAVDASFDSPSGRSRRGSHQLASAFICERLWWLRYDQRLVLAKDKEFRVLGTLVHLCLAYWYASRMPQPPSWYYEKDLATALEETGRGFPKLIQRAREVLVGYMMYYPAETDNVVPISIEREWLARIGDLDPGGPNPELDDEYISCRPDLVASIDGKNYIFDYKTRSKSWGGKNKNKLEPWNDDGEFALNWQVMINLIIMRQHMPIEGFIIERVKREPPYDYDRHILTVPERPYIQTARTARAAVRHELDIRARVAEGIPPRPSFWSCFGRYGPCDYRDICLAKADNVPVVIGDLYKKEL